MTADENPALRPFLLTADSVTSSRPEVDLDLAREVFEEAATLLHNALALDGLDEHDLQAVIAGLCEDLVAEDPGAAIRARSATAVAEGGPFHDPQAASAALLLAVTALQL